MMTALFWIVAIVLVLYVIGSGFFAWWAAQIERREEAERARFEKIMQASTPPPRAAGVHPRGVSCGDRSRGVRLLRVE